MLFYRINTTRLFKCREEIGKFNIKETHKTLSVTDIKWRPGVIKDDGGHAATRKAKSREGAVEADKKIRALML